MKMKKLLASALAAAMVVSSMVGTLVTSAATNTGSIAVESLTIEPGTATFDADITITFDAEIKSPHAILDIAAEGYTLTGVTSADTKLKIEANDGGENYAEGKVLIETDVSESVAPTYAAGSSIVLNATFAEDDTVNAEGVYAITVTATEVTSFGENDLTLTAGEGAVTVEAPHVCDMQTKYDENGHWTECTCGIKTDVVAHTLGDYVANEDGTTETAKCTGCDYTETRDIEVVGPTVDTNLKVYRTSLAYGTSSLEYNFRIENAVLSLYDNVDFVIIPQKYDMTTLNLVENPAEIVIAKADLAAAGSKYKQYTFKDIQLYELGLNIEYMLRAYDAEGNLVAVSEVFNTSIAKLLADNSADSTKSDAYRTLCVDTLVVCDEVMKNVAKSYTNSDLAAAVAAGSVLDGVDTSLATQTLGECNTVDNFVSYDDNFLYKTGTHAVRSSVAVGKVPYINFRVLDSKDVLDRSKLNVTVTYTSKDSAGEHPYERTFTGAEFTDAGNYINTLFDEVGFHDSDKDILFTVSYDGVKKCEWTYSIETYLSSMKDSANTGAQMTALIKLGQSFRTYQGL